MENILREIDVLQEEINQFRPVDKKIFKHLREYYRIGLTYSSNALEGNSLTETETKIILEDGITIGGKPVRDHYKVIGHSDAYDYMNRISKKESISEANIKHFHKLFYYRIDIKNAGKYRKERAFITGSNYSIPKPEEIPVLMKNFVAQ